MTPTIRNYKQASAYLAKGRKYPNQERRIDALHNLRRVGDDIVLTYHATDIVTYHPNGHATIYLGGWNTVSTRRNIEQYSPARVWGDKNKAWIHVNKPKITPPKVQKCRTCHGNGKRMTYGYTSYTGEFHPPTEYNCYRCGGTGKCDYGSHQVHYHLEEFTPVTVNSKGQPVKKHPPRAGSRKFDTSGRNRSYGYYY